MIFRTRSLALLLAGIGVAVAVSQVQADDDLPTKFTNQGGIANTRHNLTQSTIGAGAVVMNPYRNDYQEVCVYCHTPHGANGNVALPLWNRTIKVTSYTTYDTLGTSTLVGAVSQPGPNSLSCLSCHDGQVAVDSIINMPGSGRYNASQATAQNNAFLNTWNNATGADATSHFGLRGPECLACHSRGAPLGAGATDFTVFALGTDLKNDHPVGVKFPTAFGPSVDFNEPTGFKSNVRFFDLNGNGRPDTKEVRMYDSGDGFEVECASCHDPHGVPSGAPGSTFNKTFLRVTNDGSALCLTCHTK